jgi:hypothetical protein
MALKPSLRDVLTRLQADGTLPADAIEQAQPPLEAWWKKHGATPWYVRVLIGGGAWLAAFFLLLFFGLMLSMMGVDSEVGLIVVGLLVTGCGLFLRRLGEHDFLTQLSLSIGLAGQGMFVFGVADLTDEEVGAAVALLAMQVPLLFISPDRIQRFLSTVGASGAALFLLYKAGGWSALEVGLVGVAAGAQLVFLQQARLQHGRLHGLASPLGYGLVSVLFGVLLTRAFQDSGSLSSGLLTLGLAAVTLYTAHRVLAENDLEASGAAGVTVFAALGLTALLTLHTPGVIAALGILALAFHRRSTLLLGMAVAFLLGFGVHYYYDLALSLLAKSLALLGSGLLLFGLRLFVSRRFPAAPASEVR